MDWVAHHSRMVDHFASLYEAPGFGPIYTRAALAEYLRLPSCPFPKIGHDVKLKINVIDPDGLLSARDNARVNAKPDHHWLLPSPEHWGCDKENPWKTS